MPSFRGGNLRLEKDEEGDYRRERALRPRFRPRGERALRPRGPLEALSLVGTPLQRVRPTKSVHVYGQRRRHLWCLRRYLQRRCQDCHLVSQLLVFRTRRGRQWMGPHKIQKLPRMTLLTLWIRHYRNPNVQHRKEMETTGTQLGLGCVDSAGYM